MARSYHTIAAGLIAVGGTVAGFLGRFWWPFDIFSHFRVQYFLGLTLIAILLGMLRWKWSALIFTAFALLNFALILPLYLREGGVQRGREIHESEIYQASDSPASSDQRI